MKHFGPVLVFAAALLFGSGCGSGNSASSGLDMGGPEANEIAALVEELNDANTSNKKLEALFVKGSKPGETKKFAKCSFYISGKPSVSGDSAVCKVRIDNAAGTTLGEPEWSFEKDGGKWKVKTAPLP